MIVNPLKSIEPEPGNPLNWHIHLQGLVQGVGFRPFVYQVATQKNLKGAVSNGVDGLHIWLHTTLAEAEAFLRHIIENKPVLARITASSLQPAGHQLFANFSIIGASPDAAPNLWITPDLSICPDCLKALQDPRNRRYQYPFITCTQCGPRYSIMQYLPFERHFTSMNDFPMCPECLAEYENPEHPRFYAQTNSCPTCGVKINVFDAAGTPVTLQNEEIISFVTEKLRLGKILAVKGIGGFLLMADAGNAGAILALRRRKQRPAKPFAVLYPTLEQVMADTKISDAEAASLKSLEAPIVLVTMGESMRKRQATAALAPGLDRIGVMLPYAPLLRLIAMDFNQPLLATSANVSGSPILFKNEEALHSLKGIADCFIVHNRDIVAPQDDSVLCFAPESGIPILLRRSRGWAPAFPHYTTRKTQTVLATGALLKCSFTLAHQQQVYISQYLGNTETWEAQQVYRHTLGKVQALIKASPNAILTDTHPDYFSVQLAREWNLNKGIPLNYIPHHKAHFAAILGESGLLLCSEPVLGVIWDGTGFGEDGQSWGGEFFVYHNRKMNRICHFGYFPYLLGDKMAKEPRISALALTGEKAPETLKNHFSPTEWNLYTAMLQKYTGIYTSSAGRLFDAVACLVTGIDTQSFEGEAAMRLEAEGRTWCRVHGYDCEKSYITNLEPDSPVSPELFTEGVIADQLSGLSAGEISAKFHFSLAALIKTIAEHYSLKHIACSGGVFQNSLLTDMVHALCHKDFHLHFHRHLSPNDENISFGQLVYFDHDMDG